MNSLEFLVYPLPSGRFDTESLLSLFVNFDLDLIFQGHMLQESDDQTQCDHFGEKRLNDVGDINRLFLFTQLIIFHPENRDWIVRQPPFILDTFIDPKFIDRNPQTNLEPVGPFSRN